MPFDSSVDVIVDTDDGFFFSPIPDMGLNDAGTIAFTSANKLVVADVDGFDVILEPGDTLFGSTLASLYYLKSLNDQGEIGFIYVLANGTAGIAVASTAFLEADFDEDGGVDNADLMTWETGYGANGGALHMDGNADSDLDVDGDDFLFWQRQYTGSLAIDAATTALPEPGALAMLVCWATTCALGFRRRWSPQIV